MVVKAPEPARRSSEPPVPALEISGLSISLRAGRTERPLVTDVNLSVGAGEIVGLVGESGSGKSLTALASIGLLPDGVEVSSGARAPRRASPWSAWTASVSARCAESSISMIFQDPLSSLDPCSRIGNQIVETIRAHRNVSVAEARRDALELLDRVGIPRAKERMRSYPYEFSGGMRQRVMIAAALVLRPRGPFGRRAHNGARCHHTGRHREAGPRAAVGAADECPLDLPRPRLSSVGWPTVLRSCTPARWLSWHRLRTCSRAPQHPYTAGLIRSGDPTVLRRARSALSPVRSPSPGTGRSGCRFSPRCDRATRSVRCPPGARDPRPYHGAVRSSR